MSGSALAASERGYVAVGADANWWQDARHDTWVSVDGVNWRRIPQPDQPRFDYGPGWSPPGPPV